MQLLTPVAATGNVAYHSLLRPISTLRRPHEMIIAMIPEKRKTRTDALPCAADNSFHSAQINTVGAGLYHWSAMSFRNHWRATVGVAIMKHAARCLRRAGTSAASKRGVNDPRPHDGLDSI